jgi:methylmalonyl-CoA/ethylmalonyl-CoA epimerase
MTTEGSTMSTDTSGAFGLGPIDQISFAVVDLQAALPLYSALFGDFTTRRVELRPDRVSYRGQPASARLLLGFGRTGDVEVELVEVEEGEAPRAPDALGDTLIELIQFHPAAVV